MSTPTAVVITFGIFCAVLLVALLRKTHVKGVMSFHQMTLELEATDRPQSPGADDGSKKAKK